MTNTRKAASALGITVFIAEELGDARLRCNQLKSYIDEAVQLIEKSEHRDHFFEVAGHLLHGIPDSLMRIGKALDSAAMAVARWDYENVKEDLKPEKVEQLEDALKDVRVRRVKRKSSQGGPMKVREAVQELNQIAESIDQTGHVDTGAIMGLIASLEGGGRRTAASTDDIAGVMRRLAQNLGGDECLSPGGLASALRRVVADTLSIEEAGPELPEKRAFATDPVPEAYDLAAGFEYIRSAAMVAYRRGASGTQLRQAFDQLASIVMEIGLMCESVGATDVPNLAARLSKGVRLARRFLKPDVMDNMLTASIETESRFEEGKPADPTEHMSDEDADRWKTEHEKHKDEFKAASSDDDDDVVEASSKAKDLVPKVQPKKYSSDDKRSRFEKGKPADPTEHMSEEDAEQWKTEHEKHKDKFKKAALEAWKA